MGYSSNQLGQPIYNILDQFNIKGAIIQHYFDTFIKFNQINKNFSYKIFNNFIMEKHLQKRGANFIKISKQLTSSTFYSTRQSQRQYFSVKKNISIYSQTAYNSPSASPSPQKQRSSRVKNGSLSPDRKCAYWQNWLLPQGIRKQTSLQRPVVTATSACSIFSENNQIFFQQNSRQTRQIASLTKIMTAFTVINICNTYGVKIRQTWIKVQKQALMMDGTMAFLRNDEQLLVIDLLFALLLPSGNDAAYTLAQYFGQFLSYNFAHQNHHNFGQNQQGINKFNAQKQFYDSEYKDEAIKLFVFEMNKIAHRIGLKGTNFSNPTGLTDVNNYSTAYDMAIMISFCLKNHLMRSIFRKKVYICEARNQKLATIRQIQWKNTNKHLFTIKDCIGIKTGITPGAGPCLSTAYKIMGKQLIIVVLNSKSLDDRYVDSQKIYKYARHSLQKEQQQGQM